MPSSAENGLVDNGLSRQHVEQALTASPDDGETLNFSHQNLSHVGEEGSSELASLRKDIEQDQSSVSRIALSYNRLTTLPVAFSLLARLRYLNLRSNLFTTVPDVLTIMPSLEILDLSRNAIRCLPDAPGTLVKLQILSISRNHLIRLPSYLSSFQKLTVLKVDHNPITWPPPGLLDAPADTDDPTTMQEWLTRLKKWLQERAEEGEDSMRDSHETHPGPISGARLIPSTDSDRYSDLQPHARNASYDSTSSSYSTSSELADPLYPNTDTRFNRFGSDVSSSPSMSPVVPPADPQEANPAKEFDSSIPQHLRNMSYSVGDPPSRIASLSAKKSLPDLRIIKSHNTDIEARQIRNTETSTNQSRRTATAFKAPPVPSASRSTNMRVDPSNMSVERNTYFKRFSSHLAAGISAAVPSALLSVVDAVRGIYFAIHQIYEQVEHYTTWTFDERISGVLRKLLEPARAYMSQLIISLDQFDAVALSSKVIPSPLICRAVLESGRDNISICGKVIAALQLQLKVLAGSDDERFTRSLVLMLYGSTAELSHSWTTVTQQIGTIYPLLKEDNPENSGQSYNGYFLGASPQGTSQLESFTTATKARSTVEHIAPRTRSAARRHAGSFSVKDLELGRTMIASPSSPFSPDTKGSPPMTEYAGTSAVSPPKRSAEQDKDALTSITPQSQAKVHITGVTPSLTTSYEMHSSNAGSSSYKARRPPQQQHLELPSDSSRIVDRELLDTITGTVENARILWLMVQDVASNSANSTSPLYDALEIAMQTTEKLAQTLAQMEDNPIGLHDKGLFDDSLTFIKTVAQVSIEIKKFGTTEALPSTLRVTAAKLAQSTKELAVLLHVSSYSPSTTSTPTPLQDRSALSASPFGGSILARSRSAQPTVSAKLHAPSTRDTPRSAINQKFTIPSTGSSSTRTDLFSVEGT